MNNTFKDFRLWATSNKVNGCYASGLSIDDYAKYMNSHIHPMAYQSPTVAVPSQNYSAVMDIYSVMMADRCISINSEIEPEMANIVACELRYLNSLSSNDDIQLSIDSPGGRIDSGKIITSSIQYIEAPVRTILIGEACSMASVIYAVGDTRYAYESGRIMIHPASGGFYGKIADAEVSFKELQRANEEVFEILARYTRHTIDEVKELCTKVDHWMSAQEGKEWGIVDEILRPKKQIPELILSR